MRDFDNVLDETNSNLKRSYQTNLINAATVLILRGVDESVVVDALDLTPSEMRKAIEGANKQITASLRKVEAIR